MSCPATTWPPFSSRRSAWSGFVIRRSTRIPDAHFFWEARYNGTEVVTITPDFNASAMHSSKWLNPKPGTDAALAMAMVQVILEEGAIEWDYVREQTDLPFLVRTDNRKFLRQTDIEGAGARRAILAFYFWDETTEQPDAGCRPPDSGGRRAEAPTGRRSSLAIKPAFELGSWTVDTRNGPSRSRRFSNLTKELPKATRRSRPLKRPAFMPDVIREVARTFAPRPSPA